VKEGDELPAKGVYVGENYRNAASGHDKRVGVILAQYLLEQMEITVGK